MWIRDHIKWLWPFAAAILQAVRPWFQGEHYGSAEWLSVTSLALAAFVAYVVPNIEQPGIARYAKGIVVVALAGLGAAQNVLPDGITRQDVWTVGTALVAALGTLLTPTTKARAVLSSGPGRMGDSYAGRLRALAAPD